MLQQVSGGLNWLIWGSDKNNSTIQQNSVISSVSQESLKRTDSSEKVCKGSVLEEPTPGTVKVEETFKNIIFDNSWKTIDLNNNFPSFTSEQGVVRLSYTYFTKNIFPTDCITIAQDSIQILMASVYGARPWNQAFWFSAHTNNEVGLLSVANTPQRVPTYYPLNSISQDTVPLLIPSHSTVGEDGYICVFESRLGLSGFSLWDINQVKPKKIFSQDGYERIFFLGEKNLIAFREGGKVFEYWDLSKQQIVYSLDNWWQQSNFFLSFRPYNSSKQILLSDSGNYVYGFDLANRRCAFTIKLTGEPNGIGVFYKNLVGDNLFYCRECSSSKVSVFDILTGEMKYTFDIGGAIDTMSTDDFPMCVNGDSIFALQSGNRTLVNLWEGGTGKIIKTFEGTAQPITGLYCSENRLIASCDASVCNDKEARDLVIIWNIETGEQLKVITAPVGYKMSPQDITDGKLTLFVDEISSDKKVNEAFQGKKTINPMENLETNEGIHWNYPYMRILGNNSIQLDIWCTQKCTYLGSIKQTFTHPSNIPSALASYSKGALIVDNVDSTILQNYRVT